MYIFDDGVEEATRRNDENIKNLNIKLTHAYAE